MACWTGVCAPLPCLTPRPVCLVRPQRYDPEMARSRSRTPPHWRVAQKRTIKLSQYEVSPAPPVERCVTVAFHRSRRHFNYRLTIDGGAVTEVKFFKFFGVRLNRNIKFSKHIRHMTSKCAKRIHELGSPGGLDPGRKQKPSCSSV